VDKSLFSQAWYRVADIRPRLRSHAQIQRQTYRRKDWYVLQDHSTGRFHRFSSEAYLIIGLMDGRRTLGQIWEAACARLGDDMPTQDEVIGLLSQLHHSDVLQSDIPPDIADLYERQSRARRAHWLGRLQSPMAIRFPILDPDRFLERTQFIVRPLFGWAGAFIWISIVVPASVLAVLHWSELTSNLADRVMALENLFYLWWIYPVVKAAHEFGHAYAVKRWGGEVHEMGIMLLVLMPIPYVDASSSSAFFDKRKRMIVGAVGILIELLLAALTTWKSRTSLLAAIVISVTS
jgi:putative peptide zinc metalloprotease protein